jgi:Prokaryotic membrane lipoprotein lipid attachment site
MKRILLAASLLVPLSACQLPPERVQLQRLPESGPPLPYAELLTRARVQATNATEAFYVNRWSELEDAASGLEQTARYLVKAEDVPPRHKDTLAVMSSDLGKLGGKLREAAVAKDVKSANDSLQRIHLKVRELRLDQ